MTSSHLLEDSHPVHLAYGGAMTLPYDSPPGVPRPRTELTNNGRAARNLLVGTGTMRDPVNEDLVYP